MRIRRMKQRGDVTVGCERSSYWDQGIKLRKAAVIGQEDAGISASL